MNFNSVCGGGWGGGGYFQGAVWRILAMDLALQKGRKYQMGKN